VLSHRVTDNIVDNYTADVTDNNYYMYKDDIARVAAMGVKVYSFSISWSRVFPFGRGPVNEEAIAHYNDVIDTCIQYNVMPMATLYHWDTPLMLVDTYGGWLSENIVNDFVDYARVAYARFGDRVKYWFTVNERKHVVRFVCFKALTTTSYCLLPTTSIPSALLQDV
jgi:beta-glucosidase